MNVYIRATRGGTVHFYVVFFGFVCMTFWALKMSYIRSQKMPHSGLKKDLRQTERDRHSTTPYHNFCLSITLDGTSNAHLRMSTEQSKMSTEQHKMSTEQHKMSTEQRKMSIKQLKMSTEQRKLSTEQRKLSIKQRKMSTTMNFTFLAWISC